MEGLAQAGVRYQKVAEIKGLGGDIASCRGLPGNGSNRGRRGIVAVCRSPREAGMYEGRGGTATCYRG